MSNVESRSYKGSGDLAGLIALAQRIGAKMPLTPGYYHPGDFVWQLFSVDASDEVRIWRTGDGTAVACAIFEPPLTFQFAIDREVTGDDVADEALAWVEERRRTSTAARIPKAYEHLGNETLSTWVLESDGQRAALMEAHGYSRGNPGGVRFARDLERELPPIELPSGASFRRVSEGDADVEARAELHRDAWSVWGESQFSAQTYRKLRSAPLYDPELDVVLECEGRMLSYCVCWVDEVKRAGYFEPVGTRPSAAGRGFGRAVIREGMRRLRERGMLVAFVGTAAVNEAAQALYRSAGFEIADREWFYTKSVR